MPKPKVPPFKLTKDDVASNVDARKQVRLKPRKPQYQQLSEDAIWLLEMDLKRTRRSFEENGGMLTDKQHHRLIKGAEQVRKLRATEAELSKLSDPSQLDDDTLLAEFNERCEAAGLDPAKVRQVLGLEANDE